MIFRLSRLPKSTIKVGLGLWLFLAASIVILTVYSPQPLSARSLSSISAEVTSLNTRVNQLESQVRQLSRSIAQSKRTVSPNPPANKKIPVRSIEPSDPMFDRLANLAIELKERLDKLEERIDRLEQKIVP